MVAGMFGVVSALCALVGGQPWLAALSRTSLVTHHLAGPLLRPLTLISRHLLHSSPSRSVFRCCGRNQLMCRGSPPGLVDRPHCRAVGGSLPLGSVSRVRSVTALAPRSLI